MIEGTQAAPTNELRFCKDCDNATRNGFGRVNAFAKCRHPEAATGLHMVLGSGGKFCDLERTNGKCGRAAANFRARA